MASSEVKVTLMSGVEVPLATDNPNIGNLVSEIICHRGDLDIDGISVTCENEKFDVESFSEIIRDSVKQLLEAIELEKDAFDEALCSLDAENTQA